MTHENTYRDDIYDFLDFLALFGNWIDFNFKSSLDIAVYIYKLQCKPK